MVQRAILKSDVERLRVTARAFSNAADTACNQWNGLPRTDAWRAMTPAFQRIWNNLKNISDDHHKLADRLEAKRISEEMIEKDEA